MQQPIDTGAHSRSWYALRGLEPHLWVAEHPWAWMSALAISEAVALWCIVRLWREATRSATSKLGWSIVLLMPVFGPIAYGAFSDD